jgi:hypothetical protein
MATNVPPVQFFVALSPGLIQMPPPECQFSAQPVEIEIGERAVRAVEIAHGTLENRARTYKVASGHMMESDRQLNHTLEVQAERPTQGAGPIARDRAPHVFESFMRVEEPGAVEQTDTAVDLCIVEHGFNECGLY